MCVATLSWVSREEELVTRWHGPEKTMARLECLQSPSGHIWWDSLSADSDRSLLNTITLAPSNCLCSCSVHLILILMVWIRFIITLLRNDQLPGEGIKYCNYPIYKILSNWEIKYIKLIFVLKIWRVLKLIQDYDGFDSDENWSLLGLTFYWYAFNSSLRL